MNVGDVYRYEINGVMQIIRKEKSFYVTYIEKDASFYEIDELPFIVIKYSLEKRIQDCIKYIANQYSLPEKEAIELLRHFQLELVQIGLLSPEHIYETK